MSGAEPGRIGDLDLLEEPEILDALLRALHLVGVEGVALDELEFAADHLVERAHIADDVDALDVDPRSLLHIEGDVDRCGRSRLRVISRFDLDKGVAAVAERVGQHRDRMFDLLGVVPVARVHGQQRQHRRRGGRSLSLMLTSTLPKR